jgi:hypothetical protein
VVGDLAYGLHADEPLTRIDGTSYFYRDASKLMQHDAFEELARR